MSKEDRLEFRFSTDDPLALATVVDLMKMLKDVGPDTKPTTGVAVLLSATAMVAALGGITIPDEIYGSKEGLGYGLEDAIRYASNDEVTEAINRNVEMMIAADKVAGLLGDLGGSGMIDELLAKYADDERLPEALRQKIRERMEKAE